MRHLLTSLIAACGLLLISLPARAQYQPAPYYNNQGYESALSAIEGTLTSSGVSLNALQSADQWNYYAARTFPGFTPPAPETLFPSLANAPSSYQPYTNASHDPVSFTTWWDAIQPYLQGY